MTTYTQTNPMKFKAEVPILRQGPSGDTERLSNLPKVTWSVAKPACLPLTSCSHCIPSLNLPPRSLALGDPQLSLIMSLAIWATVTASSHTPLVWFLPVLAQYFQINPNQICITPLPFTNVHSSAKQSSNSIAWHSGTPTTGQMPPFTICCYLPFSFLGATTILNFSAAFTAHNVHI